MRVIGPKLRMVLLHRFEAAYNHQTHDARNQFKLNFEEFIDKWTDEHLDILRHWIQDAKKQRGPVSRLRKMEARFKHPKWGLILSWINGDKSDVMDPSNCEVMTRDQSLKNVRFKEGDQHSEASKAKMSASHTGKKHKESTKEQIRESCKGREFTPEHIANLKAAKKGKGKTPETKTKMRLARAQREQEKQAKILREQMMLLSTHAEAA